MLNKKSQTLKNVYTVLFYLYKVQKQNNCTRSPDSS